MWMVEHHLSDDLEDLSWCYEQIELVINDHPEQLVPLIKNLLESTKGIVEHINAAGA
jgi:hypothetical protein